MRTLAWDGTGVRLHLRSQNRTPEVQEQKVSVPAQKEAKNKTKKNLPFLLFVTGWTWALSIYNDAHHISEGEHPLFSLPI